MECINIASNGRGNEYILSSITEAIYEYNDIALVIAMWSEFDRIDFPISHNARRWMKIDYEDKNVTQPNITWPGKTGNPTYKKGVLTSYDDKENSWDNHSWVTPNANVIYIHPTTRVQEWLRIQNEFVIFSNKYGIYSKRETCKKSLRQFILFKHLMKSCELKYMQCVGVEPITRGEIHDLQKERQRQMAYIIIDSKFYDKLDEPNFVGWPILDNIGGYVFDDILPRNIYDPDYLEYRISKTDSHPNTKGHKIFADKLYDEYNKIYGKE